LECEDILKAFERVFFKSLAGKEAKTLAKNLARYGKPIWGRRPQQNAMVMTVMSSSRPRPGDSKIGYLHFFKLFVNSSSLCLKWAIL
jgi:hypothetical protein